MKLLAKGLILTAALGLAACSNPDRFGGNNVNLGGANGGIVPGSASDPTSSTFFQAAVGDRVLFAVDQATLSVEAQSVLSGQANWLSTNTSYAAIIEGHADEQGTREYNLALGARRAQAVQDYLIGQGVSPARLKTISYGKERPIQVCSDETCYSQNRRAVTVLSAGLSG
jgi:peptidoglycan-associated lipoprotein